MCGICGVIEPGKDNKALVKHMTDLIEHRGPDSEGVFSVDDICFGHRRLSIIDLKTGDQPMFNEDRSIVVIFNGEIYNFLDFKNSLEQKGHQFRTKSDTEILVHAYEEYGTSFLKDLNGIFAFALYDANKKRTLLVRDHFGIKPMHYWHRDHTFIFSSEQKAILLHPQVDRRLNKNALHVHLNLRYNQGQETLFQGIFRLEPGHYLVYENNQVTTRQYYSVPTEIDNTISEKAVIEGIRHHLKTAVNRQLLSDVPIGVYLSGGMDSSSLVAMMNDLNVPQINTFTMGFNENTDEFPDANEIASHFSTNHHTTSLALDPLRQFPQVIWHAEEPKINLLQGFNMSAFVSPNYKVILGGLGGDELFAGYDINKYINTARFFLQHLPGGLQKLILEPLSKLLFHLQNATRTFRFDEYRRGMQMLLSIGNLQKYYLILRNCWDFDAGMLNNIYHPQFETAGIESIGSYFDLLFDRTRDLNILDAIAHVEFQSKMVNDYLLVDDRMSMAHSVELRVPFLDKDLVEFMFGVPGLMKIRGNMTKFLFREAMRDYLPQKIIQKKKWGFTVNAYEQFKKDLKVTVERILTPEFIEEQGIFNYHYIKRILDYPPHPRMRWHYNYLWIAVGIAIWEKMFINSDNFLRKKFDLQDYYNK
jgi:asparagine synthase (glutamine-hydrolysing)